MRSSRLSTKRMKALSAALALGVALSSSVPVLAQGKPIKVSGTGQIVARDLCPGTTTFLCQTAVVTGVGQRLGAFTAVFSDQINLIDGTYTGTGLITVTDGSTFTTSVFGQSSPPDENGVVAFVEVHTVVSGTGQYVGSSGQITIAGTADASGHLVISGTGTFDK